MANFNMLGAPRGAPPHRLELAVIVVGTTATIAFSALGFRWASAPLEPLMAFALLMWLHRDRSGIVRAGEYVELRTSLWRARALPGEIDRVVVSSRMSTVFVRRRGTWRGSQMRIGRWSGVERRAAIDAVHDVFGVGAPGGPEFSVADSGRVFSLSEAFLRYPLRTFTWPVTPTAPRVRALVSLLVFLAALDALCWAAYLVF